MGVGLNAQSYCIITQTHIFSPPQNSCIGGSFLPLSFDSKNQNKVGPIASSVLASSLPSWRPLSAISHIVFVLTKCCGVKHGVCVLTRAVCSLAVVREAFLRAVWSWIIFCHGSNLSTVGWNPCISHALHTTRAYTGCSSGLICCQGIPPEFIFWSWCVRGLFEVKRYRVVFIYLFMSCSYPCYFNLLLSAESDWNEI